LQVKKKQLPLQPLLKDMKQISDLKVGVFLELKT